MYIIQEETTAADSMNALFKSKSAYRSLCPLPQQRTCLSCLSPSPTHAAAGVAACAGKEVFHRNGAYGDLMLTRNSFFALYRYIY